MQSNTHANAWLCKAMSFAPFNNPWRKAPVVPYSSSDSGITLLPAPSHPPCGKHWFMLVSSSLTAARPFPAFTGFSYIASAVTRYSVLPHKALPMKNIVNNSGRCKQNLSCPSPNGHRPFTRPYFRGFHSARTMPATMATAPAIATDVMRSPRATTAVIIVTSGIA